MKEFLSRRVIKNSLSNGVRIALTGVITLALTPFIIYHVGVQAMSKMILEIPDDLVEALRVPPEERLARLRRELAVRLYQKGLLSFGKARELVGMSKWEFHFLLGEEGIVRRYDVEELEGDLRTLEALG